VGKLTAQRSSVPSMLNSLIRRVEGLGEGLRKKAGISFNT
jgi:hypothetical protein